MARTALNWIRTEAVISWDMARAIASSIEAVLLKVPQPNAGGISFVPSLAEAGPSDSAHEFPVWTGAHRTAAGWVWEDGSMIDISFFQPGSVNADLDPANDTLVAAHVGSRLNETGNYQANSLIVEYFGNSITGTKYADWFILGGAETGRTVRMGYGDDQYGDYNDQGLPTSKGGGTIDAGPGDDLINVEAEGFTTVIDGDGRDQIMVAQGLIKASLDADDDSYLWVNSGRISYAAATEALTASYGNVYSAQVGRDDARAPEIAGGKGDDVISGFARIQGGQGNDRLTPTTYAEGGAGNDTLYARSGERVDLRGEAGDDSLYFSTDAKASGGSGNDSFFFEEVARVTINDLGQGDLIDLSAVLADGVGNPFEDGYLQLSLSKGYTYVSIDTDGGGDDFQPLLTLKGNFADPFVMGLPGLSISQLRDIALPRRWTQIRTSGRTTAQKREELSSKFKLQLGFTRTSDRRCQTFCCRLAPEADFVGQLLALSRIVGCNHGVVERQTPFRAIFFRRHIVICPEIALEHLEFLTIFKTYDVVWLD
jgi:hypothetical protein